MAAAAGISLTAIRAAERGLGRLSSFHRITAALGVELRGRNLPAGPLGPALLALRQRRRQSRRSVAVALGVSRTTLAALEGGTGLLTLLEAYGGAIGAGLHLAAVGEPQRFYTHAGNSGAYQGWETPAELADRLTRATGGFDLDPCAASRDRKRVRVKARLLLTVDDDGLSVPWRGRVYVNPPYGRTLGLWVRKSAEEAARGEAVVVALLPARSDTRWWHDHVAGQAHVFMLRGRLQFGAGLDNAPFPSAVVVWGAADDLVSRLRHELPEAWHVPPSKA